MATSTIVLFTTMLVCVCHHIAGQNLGPRRYQDQDVIDYFNRICQRVQPCGFEQVCELQVYPCLIPPCPKGPYCVSTPGASMKPGNCPNPGLIGSRRVIQCNTDYGCPGNQLCCHGYGTSRCMRPRGNGYRREY